MEPKPNPAGCAKRKLFRKGDFFSTLLGPFVLDILVGKTLCHKFIDDQDCRLQQLQTSSDHIELVPTT